jgi:hypothetical protein
MGSRTLIKRSVRPDFESDVRRIVLETLPHRASIYGDKLRSFPTSKLIILYYNWRSRFVTPKPRSVLRSREFKSNLVVEQFQPHINILLGKIAAGVSVNAHLSSFAKVGYEEDRGERIGRRAVDLLLNDWGVHHLHFFGDEKASRVKEVVFAIFGADTAYVLDLFTHSDWTHERIVQIAVNNWPEKNLFLELKGAQGLARSVTPDSRALRRKAGVNSPIELDGKVYMGRGGLSSAGTSFTATIKADQLLHRLRVYAQDSQLLSHMWSISINRVLSPPRRPSFEVVEDQSGAGYGFALRERETGARLWIG